MKPCNDIHRYFDQNMSPHECEQFNAHLHECIPCSEDVHHWQETREVMQDTFGIKEEAPTDEMVYELLERAATEETTTGPKQATRISSLWVAIPLAAAAVAVLAFAVLYQPDGSKFRIVPPTESLTVVQPDIPLSQQASRVALEKPLSEGHTQIGRHHIWVAPGSRVQMEVGNRRVAHLERGRFVIRHEDETAHKIRVVAGPYVVEEIGTLFEVTYAPSKHLSVTVAKGAVEVSGFGTLPIRLVAHQSLSITETDAHISLKDIGLVEIRRVMSPFVTQDKPQKSRPEPQRENRSLPKTKPEETSSPVDQISRWRQMVVAGEYQIAQSEIVDFLARDKMRADVWSILADCRRKERDFHGAIDAYRQVLVHGSRAQSSRAQFLIGEIYQDRLHEHELAASTFEAFLKNNEKSTLRPAALLRLAKSKHAQGDRLEAGRVLREIVRGPYSPEMKNRARLLFQEMKTNQ